MDTSRRRLRRGATVLLATVLVLGAAIWSSSIPPTVRFLRFATGEGGQPVAACIITNHSVLPTGVLGYGPTMPQWRTRNTTSGEQLDFGYFCATGMSFHYLGPFQSREVHLPSPPDVHSVRYGIFFNSPFYFCRDYIENIAGRSSDWHVTWTPEIP